MSLITTLIPAYKPDHLDEVFQSLTRQSLQDFTVVLSDDSPGARITEALRAGRWGPLHERLQLTVIRGPGNARRNHLHLIDTWRRLPARSPYVHLLMDDDVLLPGFYAAHLAAHEAAPCAVSVSARWLSRGDSQPVGSTALPAFVTGSERHRVAVDAQQLWASVVVPCDNWLGELTNMVWSAEGIAHFPRPPTEGLSYYGLMDISAVLEAVQHGLPLVYIRDHLSVFRQHGAQTTHSVGTHGHRVSVIMWAACALHAWAQGRIDGREAVQSITTTVGHCLALYGETDPVVNGFLDLVQHQGRSLGALHPAFTGWWLALLAGHPATASA